MKQTKPHGNIYKEEHDVEQLKFVPSIWQTLKKKEIEKLIKSQKDEGQNLYLRRKKIVSTSTQVQACNLHM